MKYPFKRITEKSIIQKLMLEDSNPTDTDPHEILTALLCFKNSSDLNSFLNDVKSASDFDRHIEKLKKDFLKKIIGAEEPDIASIDVLNDKSNFSRIYNMLMRAISAAITIRKYWGDETPEKIYLTGKKPSKDIEKFFGSGETIGKVVKNVYGMKDYNSSDIVLYGQNKFLGVSLKHKKDENAPPPTLINLGILKYFDNIKKFEVQDKTGNSKERTVKELEKCLNSFYNSILGSEDFLKIILNDTSTIKKLLEHYLSVKNNKIIVFDKEEPIITDKKSKNELDINLSEKEKNTKKGFSSLTGRGKDVFHPIEKPKTFFNGKIDGKTVQKISVFKNAIKKAVQESIKKEGSDIWKNLLSSQWFMCCDTSKKIVRDYINPKLNPVSNNQSWFNKLQEIMLDNNLTSEIAKSLVDIIFKIEITKLNDYNFDFALCTGMGNCTFSNKDGTWYFQVNDAEFFPQYIINNTLKGFKGKPNLEIDTSMINELDIEDNLTSKIFFKLNIGKINLGRIEIRYKGSFTASPQIFFFISSNLVSKFKEGIKR